MPCVLQLGYLGAISLVFTVRLQQGGHRGCWTKRRPGTDGETSMRQQGNADKCIDINLQCVKGDTGSMWRTRRERKHLIVACRSNYSAIAIIVVVDRPDYLQRLLGARVGIPVPMLSKRKNTLS